MNLSQDTCAADASAPCTSFQLEEPRYEAFRLCLLAKYGTSHCNCGSFSRAFAREFPELRAATGYYYPKDRHSQFRTEHWWLEDARGRIIDPTADQFECQGRGRYEPYDPRRHLTIKGSCPCCGMGLVTGQGSRVCSRACAEDLANDWGCRPGDGPFEEDLRERVRCDLDIVTKLGRELKLPTGGTLYPAPPALVETA